MEPYSRLAAIDGLTKTATTALFRSLAPIFRSGARQTASSLYGIGNSIGKTTATIGRTLNNTTSSAKFEKKASWDDAFDNLSSGAGHFTANLLDGAAAMPGFLSGLVAGTGSFIKNLPRGLGKAWQQAFETGGNAWDSVEDITGLGRLRADINDYNNFNTKDYINRNNIDINNPTLLDKLSLLSRSATGISGQVVGGSVAGSGVNKLLNLAKKGVNASRAARAVRDARAARAANPVNSAAPATTSAPSAPSTTAAPSAPSRLSRPSRPSRPYRQPRPYRPSRSPRPARTSTQSAPATTSAPYNTPTGVIPSNPYRPSISSRPYRQPRPPISPISPKPSRPANPITERIRDRNIDRQKNLFNSILAGALIGGRRSSDIDAEKVLMGFDQPRRIERDYRRRYATILPTEARTADYTY